MKKITIYQFTDPVCIWCWGNVPVLKAIDFLYGDKVGVEYIMGGLVEDISTLYDIQASPSERIRQANAIIARNWIAASARHGMPVVTDNFELFTERYPSSFPQNIAYQAAKLIDAGRAKRFLHLVREATFTKSRRTSQIDVLIDLAVQAGYDAATFLDEYTTGHAQSAFAHDRMVCRRNGITGFPSYIVRNEDTSIIIGGYQNLGTFHTLISRLSAGKIKPRRIGPSRSNVMEFMHTYKTAYPVELEVAFSLERHQTNILIDELIAAKKIDSEAVGNSRRLYLHRATHS
ncbi:MAG: DsbA family protein [Alistipes sp.]|nr:DsbA family protein [Alistipes sp.]